MRTLNAAGWATLLVVSLLVTTPVLVAAAPAPLPGATIVQSTQKDKKKAAKKKETISIKVPSSASKGEKDVEITGKTSSDDRTCEMSIKWNDGTSTDVEKVKVDNGRMCTFKVDVPKNSKVVGEASVEMKSTDGHGKKLASASRILHVE